MYRSLCCTGLDDNFISNFTRAEEDASLKFGSDSSKCIYTKHNIR